MNGWTIPLILVGIAVLLWIISYFLHDSEQNIQEEFEELSLDLLQDMHQIKKRMETMEEELEIESDPSPNNGRIMDITKRHVLTLYTKGVGTEDIVEQIKISETAVKDIIDDYIAEGL